MKIVINNLVVEKVSELPGLAVLLERVKGESDYFLLGDFSPTESGGYSYLGIEPREVVSFEGGSRLKGRAAKPFPRFFVFPGKTIGPEFSFSRRTGGPYIRAGCRTGAFAVKPSAETLKLGPQNPRS